MIPSGLFTQIALFLLSIGIIFTYIKPAFETISVAQEQIATYQQEVGKVSRVNAELQSKLQEINSVSGTDRDRLFTYIPNQVDPLEVMRDLESVAAASGVELEDITNGGPVDDSSNQNDQFLYGSEFSEFGAAANQRDDAYAYSFSISVDGTYNQTKNLISLIESNNYPLEIQNVSIGTAEGGFLSTQIDLYTYSLESAEETEETVYQDVNVIYE